MPAGLQLRGGGQVGGIIHDFSRSGDTVLLQIDVSHPKCTPFLYYGYLSSHIDGPLPQAILPKCLHLNLTAWQMKNQ